MTDTKDDNGFAYSEGLAMVRLARRFAAKGDHTQAADSFQTAAGYFDRCRMTGLAAWCRTHAVDERQWVRPTPPANVSALVD